MTAEAQGSVSHPRPIFRRSSTEINPTGKATVRSYHRWIPQHKTIDQTSPPPITNETRISPPTDATYIFQIEAFAALSSLGFAVGALFRFEKQSSKLIGVQRGRRGLTGRYVLLSRTPKIAPPAELPADSQKNNHATTFNFFAANCLSFVRPLHHLGPLVPLPRPQRDDNQGVRAPDPGKTVRVMW